MKRMTLLIVVAVFCLLWVLTPPAHAGLLDISGLTELIADKAKEGKAVYSVSFRGTHGAAAYLPAYTFHSKPDANGKKISYLDVGVGGGLQEGGKAEAFFPLMGDVVALSNRAWRTNWRKNHITMTKLPPIWFGLIFAPDFSKAPSLWVIGDVLRGGVSIGFGGK